MKLPDEIRTQNPKEAIAFCIAYGIEEGILPEKFNMTSDAYDVLQAAINRKWGTEPDEVINEIMIAFIAGYAVGKGEVQLKR